MQPHLPPPPACTTSRQHQVVLPMHLYYQEVRQAHGDTFTSFLGYGGTLGQPGKAKNPRSHYANLGFCGEGRRDSDSVLPSSYYSLHLKWLLQPHNSQHSGHRGLPFLFLNQDPTHNLLWGKNSIQCSENTKVFLVSFNKLRKEKLNNFVLHFFVLLSFRC